MARTDRACRRARREFDAYLDGEAAPRRVRMLEQHLAGCEPCRQLLAQRRREFAAISELPVSSAPSDFTERVMAGLADRPTPTARLAARLRPRMAFAAGIALAAVGVWLWVALRAPEAPPMVRHDRPAVREEQAPTPQRDTDEIVDAPRGPQTEEPEVRQTPEPAPRRAVPKQRPRVAPRDSQPAPAPKPQPKPEPEPEPEVVVEESPDPIAIADYRELGEAYEREGMLAEALEAYEVAAADDESPMAMIGAARVIEKMGDTVSAIEAYAEAAFTDFTVIYDEEVSET